MIKSVTPPERRSETDRPRRPARPWSTERVLARLASQPLNDRMLPPSEVAESAFAHVTNCLAQALPETKTRSASIRVDLKRAGDYRPLAYEKLAALRLVGMMASLVAFGTLTICVSPQSEPWSLAALALGMFAAWWLPVWRLQRRAARRMHAIELAMPDLSDMLRVCLSQALTIPAALATASRELRPIHPALALELAIACRQTELESLEAALEDLETRIDLPEIRSFVTLVLQADDRSDAETDQPASNKLLAQTI
jgi:Flp pilus assembly protein TadB